MGRLIGWATVVALGASTAYAAEWLVKVDDPKTLANLDRAGLQPVYRFKHFPWAVYGSDPSVAMLEASAAGVPLTVEPNVEIQLNRFPNDPRVAEQWMVFAYGPESDIRLPAAWDVSTSAPGVVVAVIDTGVKIDHPDLAPNIWRNMTEWAGTPGVDDDGNGWTDDVYGWGPVDDTPNVMDTDSHGTRVAGLIGARGDNGIGVSGVCWSVKIMPIRAFNGTVSNLVNALKGIDYVLSHPQVRIINASWGTNSYSQALYDALAAARDLGVVVVTSAGNSARNLDVTPEYPASFDLDNIVSVAAITPTGNFAAAFSNYGSRVTLAAPGVNVLSTGLNDQYTTGTGTSFSAPIVSGAVALLIGREPGIAPQAVRTRLINSSTRTDPLAGIPLAGGLLNVEELLLHTVNGARRWEYYR